jgi:hypothetical protein
MATRTKIHLSHMVLPLVAMTLTGCAYDSVSGQAPRYGESADYVYGGEALGEQGYDGQWNPSWSGVEQPGDLFGGQDVQSINAFYEPLAPYGQWVETRWGRAFAPDVPREWRPYTNGRWTEYRLWISNDPWGWATDHYGRWAHDDRIGWLWVPDTRWGPHWVAFRENEQYAGWAPIPPQVNYNIGVGFGRGFGGGFGYDNWNSWYGPSWVWAPAGAIFLPGLNRRILPYGGGLNYWQATRWQHWTPWTAGRGWAGAPGRNYWRGSSPIGNRIGGSIGARPGLGQPYGGGYRRPQQGWDGQPGVQRPNGIGGRPGWQRPVGDGRQGWQDRRGQQPNGTAPNFGSQAAQVERPDRGNRPEQVGGYAPRPAYENGAGAQPTPRAEWRSRDASVGGGRRQLGMVSGNRDTPGSGNAVIGNAVGGSIGARAERQARPQMQAPARPMAATPPVARREMPPPAPQVRAERASPSPGSTSPGSTSPGSTSPGSTSDGPNSDGPNSYGGRRDYSSRNEN